MKKNIRKIILNNLRKGVLLLFMIIMTTLAVPANGQSSKSKAWTAPISADSLINPNSEEIDVGSKLFQQACAICHGESGKGDGIAGVALKPRPANLTEDSVQDQTEGELYWKISSGNTPMPAYEKVYSEEQRWSLVNYIKSFKKKR